MPRLTHAAHRSGRYPRLAAVATKFEQLRQSGIVLLDDVGTIASGKIADIIAVRGDVLRHLSLLQDVDLVIHRGVRHK